VKARIFWKLDLGWSERKWPNKRVFKPLNGSSIGGASMKQTQRENTHIT